MMSFSFPSAQRLMGLEHEKTRYLIFSAADATAIDTRRLGLNFSIHPTFVYGDVMRLSMHHVYLILHFACQCKYEPSFIIHTSIRCIIPLSQKKNL